MAKDPTKVAAGVARAKALTPEKRREIASRAASARWLNDKTYTASHKGNFNDELGLDIDCYVLDDPGKTAVISQRGMGEAIGFSRRGSRLQVFVNSQTMAEYIGETRLHMAYNFELLTEEYGAAHIRRTAECLERRMPHGWPCWTISNHDVVRVMTRWGGDGAAPRMASMLSAMVCSLRGSVCIYQGEELGLPEARLPFEALRDPYGIAFWPNFKGRDGCRTPMPWRDQPDAGFTTGRPWLPVPPEHLPLAASRQESDPDSPLNAFRRFLPWRKRLPALCRGDIRFLELPEPLLAFTRTLDSESILAVFNLSDRPQTAALPDLGFGPIRPLDDHGLAAGRPTGRGLELPPHGVFFGHVACRQRPGLG